MAEEARSLERLLAESLAGAVDREKKAFSGERFFRNWFGTNGSSLFFLFKKNLRVTNIQFGELFALLRSYLHCTQTGRSMRDVQFLTGGRFQHVVQELVRSLTPSTELGTGKDLVQLSNLYASLLRSTLVVEPFQGSCAVYLPPLLGLDLAVVCGLSGYIHSCGYAIFVRKANDSTPEAFVGAVSAHLDRVLSERSPRAFFAVYAHEDFTRYDREGESELRDGLDDVKVHIEKYYMGSLRLVEVLKWMSEQLRDRIVIPQPGYYKRHGEFRDQAGVDQTRTIWLITDRPLVESTGVSGPERYFLCYDQLYSNENPFHVFDENKPAWKAHTTIPHTLAGAMINVSRPWWPEGATDKIADPFVGTGTTCLECLKFTETVTEGSDLDGSAALLMNDNLAFFSGTPEEIEWAFYTMDAVGKCLESGLDPKDLDVLVAGQSVMQAYSWAVDLIDRLQQSGLAGKEDLAPWAVEEIQRKTLFERLFFYVARRTVVRNVAAFERGSHDWATAYCKEAAILARQTKDLLRKRRAETERRVDTRGYLSIFQGTYSLACSAHSDRLRAAQGGADGTVCVNCLDACALPERTFDVVIADPPYGFNTDEAPADLAHLYSCFLTSMIRALKDEGQLVICLLDRSHTGRQSLFFTNKEVVIQQILVKAEEEGFEVIMPTGRVPEPAERFKPPYYWESIRALRRAILHFRLRRRGQPTGYPTPSATC